MDERLQITADDVVLEITETGTQKQRLSEKTLLRNKDYLEQSIVRFQEQLDTVNAQLAQINTAKDAQATQAAA